MTPKQRSTPSSLSVGTRFGFGAVARSSVQTSRCAPISTRSTLRVAQIRTGMPIRSAYQRFGLFAAFEIELEIKPSSPSESAASSGDSDEASAAKPRPGDGNREPAAAAR